MYALSYADTDTFHIRVSAVRPPTLLRPCAPHRAPVQTVLVRFVRRFFVPRALAYDY